MNIYAIPLGYYAFSGAFNSITTSILAAFIWMKNPTSKVNRTCAVFFLSVAVWSLFYSFWLTTSDEALAEFYIRTCMIPVMFIPSSMIHFVDSFLGISRSRKFYQLHYLLSAIFALTIYTPLYATDTSRYLVFPYWPIPGPIFHIALAHFSLIVSYAIYLLYCALKKAQGIVRKQILFLFIGSLIGFISGSTNYFCWYRIPIPPFLNMCVSVYVFLITYSIAKHHFMDISVVITRTMLFAVVYGCVLGLPFVLGWMGQPWLAQWLGDRWWLGPLAASTLLASAGPFVYIKLQHTAEARLLREQRRYQKTLRKASQGMTHIKHLQKLVQFIVRIVSRSVGVTHASLLLWDEHTKQYVVAASRGAARLSATLTIAPTHALITHLTTTHQPLVTEELAQQADPRDRPLQQLIEELRRLRIAVVVPSFSEIKLIGCLALGDKRSGAIYSTDDLDVFTTLANQAAVAIENAQAFDALTHAHDQLKEAMTKLVASEKMAAAGQLATGLAHEIKNPLSAIRTFVTYLPERYADAAFREKFTRIVGGEVDRINSIVQQLLNFAKPAPLALQPTDINQVIQDTLAFLSNELLNRRIEALTDLRANHLPLQADPNQLRQVFLNLFLNSFEAMTTGGRLHLTTRDKSQGVEVILRDTGRGMPPEVAMRVFDPFYTTKDTGVGLGLSIVRSIVERHGGHIELASQPHEGTTVTIYLPLFQSVM